MPAPRLPVLVATACAALLVPASASVAKVRAPHRLPAAWQKTFHVRSPAADVDRDGLTNWSEYRAHTNPRRADSDRDGIPDGGEDRDRDGLENATEQRAGTDPGVRDSDHDRRSDAREDADRDGLNNLAEQRTANDPGDPDSDDDGLADGDENAGRVVSFDGDTLVLRLTATGTMISGLVDEATTLQCAADDVYELEYDDEPGEDDGVDDTMVLPGDAADDADAVSSDDDAPAPATTSTDDDPVLASTASVSDSEADAAPCDTAVLVPGAWVHAAEFSSADGMTAFDTLEIVAES